jgi:nucleotidyltransferase AbiEii toxin of type IV toxin-antitoxin system
VAYIGATPFAQFHVDLVAGIEMTAEADDVPPLVPIELPGVARCAYRAYPVPDHIADKVCAIFEVHEHGGQRVESTRYRDLADLAIFAHTQTVSADSLRHALDAEVERRKLVLPAQLEEPSGPGWRAGYARVVRDAPLLEERDIDSAMTTVRRFIEPVLAGRAEGVWNPDVLQWIS